MTDILLPYFEAGLKNNEFCLWVTSTPLDADEARALMAEAVPGFDAYLERGQIEFIQYTEWYKIDGVFDPGRVINGWVEKLRTARARGFSGLRVTGSGSWLKGGEWEAFLAYEQAVNDVIRQHEMIALCTYPLDRCDANDILEIVSTHQFALTRRKGKWKIIEDQGQKDVRKALRESEERVRVLADNLPGIYIYQLSRTPDGRYYFSYASQCDPLRGEECSVTDWDYQAFVDCVHPDDLELVLKATEESCKLLSKFDIVYRVREHDGAYRWFHSCSVPHRLEDGSTVWDGFSEDVTERKQAEDSLKLTQFAMDKMGDMCTWLTPDARIIYVNDTICKKLGYAREELLSMKTLDINPRQHNEDNWAGHWNDTKNQGSMTFETNLVKKDGSLLPVEITANYLRYGDKEYIIGVKRDITERKRAEQELKEAKAQSELYLDLMGHDINNMHQIALGYLELARDMYPEINGRDLYEKPIAVLQRSAQLIGNVRKLQKLREGSFREQTADVCGVLSDVCKEYQAIPGKHIRLNLNGYRHYHIIANELLHDVFANLVSNAIKHTGDQAEISIDLENAEENDLRYCRVSVEDNGPGIPDDFKPVIFNRMLKGTVEAKGMGLGLYLVKSLVESFDGIVWVEDRVRGDPAKGARFVVLLPATGQTEMKNN